MAVHLARVNIAELRPFGEDIIVNLSVWESVAAQEAGATTTA